MRCGPQIGSSHTLTINTSTINNTPRQRIPRIWDSWDMHTFPDVQRQESDSSDMHASGGSCCVCVYRLNAARFDCIQSAFVCALRRPPWASKTTTSAPCAPCGAQRSTGIGTSLEEALGVGASSTSSCFSPTSSFRSWAAVCRRSSGLSPLIFLTVAYLRSALGGLRGQTLRDLEQKWLRIPGICILFCLYNYNKP